MKNSNDTGILLSVLAIGTLLGTAIGVLFAPDKGSNTRAKLMCRNENLSNDEKQKMINEANAFRARAEQLEKMTEGKIIVNTNKMKQNLDV